MAEQIEISQYEIDLKSEFTTMMTGGKKAVNAFVNEAIGYINEVETPTLVEKRIGDLLKSITSENKLYFKQFKELYPFVLAERKLAESKILPKSDDDEFILLD